MKEEDQANTKGSEPVRVEKLEEKIAPAILNPKKGPMPPPYPPGAMYGLICRDVLIHTEG
jgi:hypothetical protein